MTKHALLSIGIAATVAFPALAPLAAKESLGVYDDWAVFRDPSVPRCYAIAKAEEPTRASERRRDYAPYLTVASWPQRNIRNQLHLRLSREIRQGAQITLSVGGRSFRLTGGGGDAWAQDRAMDAAIVAAMRSAARLRVSAVDATGRRFTNAYSLNGVATAIDAATVGCSPRALSQTGGSPQ